MAACGGQARRRAQGTGSGGLRSSTAPPGARVAKPHKRAWAVGAWSATCPSACASARGRGKREEGTSSPCRKKGRGARCRTGAVVTFGGLPCAEGVRVRAHEPPGGGRRPLRRCGASGGSVLFPTAPHGPASWAYAEPSRMASSQSAHSCIIVLRSGRYWAWL